MMRFGPNSGARKVWYCKRKTQKCHLRFCGTVNKKGYSFRKGVPLSGQTRTCLWYFCGQTRNRRGFYHGDFHFGGPNRDRTDDLTDANRTLSQLSYRPIFGCFVYFCSICLCSLLFWPGPCYVALALPAELWAHIGHFPSKKVMKNRFLRYSVLRRNHGKPD